MNILITGDSGFIGSYLTKYLEKKGHTVFGIDINPEKKYAVRYHYVVGDILDEGSLSKIPQGIDCIIHLAAAHKDFGISKQEYYRVNADGMRSLLHFADKRQIQKILFYSTVAVYGENQPSTEETTPNPINHYGGSKLEAEKVLSAWAQADPKREVVVIRPAVVFGPLNVANIFKLIKQVCDGNFLWVGDGRNIKSIAYVENLVEATSFLLDHAKPGFDLFNYSDEPHLQTRELVSVISKLSGKSVSKFHIPLPLAVFAASIIGVIGKITRHDFPVTSARILKFNTSTEHRSAKIRKIGFLPPYTIEEGFQKNIEWYIHAVKKSPLKIESSSE